jgi:hypothetical protein
MIDDKQKKLGFRDIVLIYVPFVIFASVLLLFGIGLLCTEIHYLRTTGCVSVSIPYKASGVLLLLYDILYVKWFVSGKKMNDMRHM